MNLSTNGRQTKWKGYAFIKRKNLLKLWKKAKYQMYLAKKKFPNTWKIVNLGIRLILISRNWE